MQWNLRNRPFHQGGLKWEVTICAFLVRLLWRSSTVSAKLSAKSYDSDYSKSNGIDYVQSQAIYKYRKWDEYKTEIPQINVIGSVISFWVFFDFILFNSLAPGKFEWNFRYSIFQIISVIDGWVISCELALRWISLDLTDDKSTLVQVMAWCRQATSHCLSQCWPISVAIWRH